MSSLVVSVFATGVMSLWNRGFGLKYLDLDPCCAVAEETLGADCHLIQQKAWSSGPVRFPLWIQT